MTTEQIAEIRRQHEEATQFTLAASDASHPLRQAHSPDVMLAQARVQFRNLGQTVVPMLLKEVPMKWDAAQLDALVALAHENSWNGVENCKLISEFYRDLIRNLKHRISDLEAAQTVVAPRAGEMLDEWAGKNPDLRYAEVSRGRRARFMVTLWQIDHVTAEDVKVGFGEGATLEEAVQRARGVIIL